MKKFVTLLLAFVLCAALLPIAPAAQATQNAPVTLKAWGAFTFDNQSGKTSYNEQLLWQEIEKRLNIKVEWTTVSAAERQQLFSLMMSSGDLPDFVVDVNPLQLEEFGRLGALLPLGDYIEKMPGLQALLLSDPQARPSITSADGSIYFFPRLMEPATRFWPGMMIRGDWLEELGLKVPTTTQELFDALVAIQEKHPECTKPITGQSVTLGVLVWPFGVGMRGTGNENDDFFVEGGQIKFGPTDPRFRDALIYLNKMYEAGLIDKEITSNTAAQVRTNMLTGDSALTFGSFAGNLSTFNNLFNADGKGMPLDPVPPLYGPTNERTSMGHHTSIDLGYGGAICATTDKADAVVRLFDYLYSDEGRELLYWGVEGKTFEIADGKHVFTEEVTKSELGILNYLNNYSGNTSCFPAALPLEFYHATLSEKGRAGNLETTEISMQNDKKVPALRYSAEEISQVNAILGDIKPYVDENFVAFIIGTKDVEDDAAWEGYLAGFRGLRLTELTDLYNTAYARFTSIK